MRLGPLAPLLSGILLLGGCSRTLVVLVPDPDGKVGEVAVSTQAGERVLTRAGGSTVASRLSAAPSQAKVMEDAEIRKAFAAALTIEPAPPSRYLLYFEFDSKQLRPDAEIKIPIIEAEVKSRAVCDMSVIGHTDRVGDANYNRALSLKRADAVADLFKGSGISQECMDIRYYGENDPAIPTPNGVPEPRNRRVEVEVR